MKIYRLFIAFVLVAVSLPAVADTFKLKNGTEIDGKIVSETDDSYLLEVVFNRSIRDERKILKSEVSEVIRELPDMKAFKSISSLVPTPDLLSDKDYGARILGVQKFLKDFPTSAKSADAKVLLATLKQESTQVASGGIKLNGNMISPREYKLNAYDLDARVQSAKVQDYLNQDQLLVALRAYANFCNDYDSTNANQELMPLMLQVIQSHVSEAKQTLLSFDDCIKKRNVGLERMSPEDRKLSESAIKEEDAALEALLKAERDGKLIWVTPNPYVKASLEETIKTGEAEIKRLSASSTVMGRDGGKAWRDAFAIIRNSKNPTTIATAITAAKAAGVSPKYMAMLEFSAKYPN